MKPKTTHNKLAMAWLLGGLLTVALPGGGLRPGGRNAGVTRGHGVSQPRSADGHPLANPIANPATFANPRTDGHPHPCAREVLAIGFGLTARRGLKCLQSR
jgi:hypothetical protein